MAEFDLLGMDNPAEPVPMATMNNPPVAQPQTIMNGAAAPATPPSVDLLNGAAAPANADLLGHNADEVIAYPPAVSRKKWKPKQADAPEEITETLINPAAVPVADNSVYTPGNVKAVEGMVMAAPCAPAVSSGSNPNGAQVNLQQRRYVVRCEGRWRIRSAPSLSSKVIGTVANGTIIMALDEIGHCAAEAAAASLYSPAVVRMPDGSDVNPLDKVVHSISTLWVKVLQFEAQEPLGVSDIKREGTGVIYCLRRNALGYGLYEVDVEPAEGPLVTLPECLSSELRTDAQLAAAEKNEDCSLTWKLMNAAESFSRLFSSVSDEAGFTEDLSATAARRRPEEVFEVKQREQFKKACAAIRKTTEKIIDKAKAGGLAPDAVDNGADCTVGLQKELRRRFQKIRSAFQAAASVTKPIIVHKPDYRETETAREEPTQADPSSATSPASGALSTSEAIAIGLQEGSVAELESFVELILRLERTGGGADFGSELRQEAVKFSIDHCRELDQYAWTLGKGVVAAPAHGNCSVYAPGGGNDGELLLLLEATNSSALSPGQRTGGGYGSGGAGFVPLLPPPPHSSCSVGTTKLI